MVETPNTKLTGDASKLTPEITERIGERLFGKHWQADFGRAIMLSRSQINRILKGTRQMADDFPIRVREAMLKKILELTVLLDSPGMPYQGTEEMKEAQNLIFEAASILRGGAKLKVEETV